MKDYQQAAERWKANTQENPDGWYADPESTLALMEHLWEVEHVMGGDPVESARNVWRRLMKEYREKGHDWLAGEVVAFERDVADWMGRRAA